MTRLLCLVSALALLVFAPGTDAPAAAPAEATDEVGRP